jgi:hypothetical protein
VLGLAFLFVLDEASAARHAGERAAKSGSAAAAGEPANAAAQTTRDLTGGRLPVLAFRVMVRYDCRSTLWLDPVRPICTHLAPAMPRLVKALRLNVVQAQQRTAQQQSATQHQTMEPHSHQMMQRGMSQNQTRRSEQ